MATDRSYWKALDQAKYGSQVAFVDVQQTMQDVHRRTYTVPFNDAGVPGNGFGPLYVMQAQRKCKVVGLSFTSPDNVVADDTDFAFIALITFRAGAIFNIISAVSTQTAAFVGGPPFGTGNLTSSVPLDLIAYQVANPTKQGIFSQVNNFIEKGDVLSAFINKSGAGVALATTTFSPALMTVDIEEE